jgi:hypothetical protein
MTEVKTEYGAIKNYLNLEMHSSGQPASLLLTGYTELETPYGLLVPQYEVEDHGRMEHKYLTFYSTGTLRKIPLQEKHYMETQYGPIGAEMLLFYKDGALKKLFPLTGKLSGYWSEENEYALAEDLTLKLPAGEITAKMISLGFHPSGNIRSLTFWPGEIVSVNTVFGNIEARTGISFYDDGGIRSLEPALPTGVVTPIGVVQAFDNDPDGISGDINSLCFDQEDNISALSTTSSRVIVNAGSGIRKIYQPTEKESLCSESVKVAIPLQIEFSNGRVRFNKNPNDEYEVAKCSFKIEEYKADLSVPTYECA